MGFILFCKNNESYASLILLLNTILGVPVRMATSIGKM